MVTSTHEATHRLFQEHPEALTLVFESLGIPPPAKSDFGSITPDATEIRPLEPVLEAMVRGLLSFEPDTTAYWFEVMEVGLENTPAKEKWRDLMSNVITHFPGHGTLFEEKYLEGKAEGKTEGKAEDRASLILRVLEKHGIDVPEDIRERITSCTDLDTLTLWFDRSLTASTAEDLFVETPEDPQPGA
ncbi:hypothetical protein [Streptomyces hokutonensis]|uniref:hypothetical protein n=1 Tax=Streptomyces hokutonensis TaxID=1306990 RepID=UPI00381BB69A